MAVLTFSEYLKQHPNYYFSNSDLQLAMSNTDFANAIMQAKDLYYTTGDEKTANQMAEQARATYGNYTAGSSGSGYTPTQTYGSQYGSQIDAALDALLNTSPYTSRWQGDIDSALNGLINRDPFSYDYKTDPVYQAYATQYTQEGKRAMDDTLASVASASGGMPSTAAVSAAQQQQNYYMGQLSGVIPELYDAAYGRYNDEYNRDLSTLGAIQSVDDTEYGRYNDTYNRNANNLSILQGLDDTSYARYLDTVSNARYNSETEYEKAKYNAETLAAYGDFSGYKAMGYSDAQISEMQTAYKAATATTSGSGGSGGGSGGGGGSKETESSNLFADMLDSGNPYSYLASHYSDYGIAYSGLSGVYEEYQAWANKNGGSSVDYTDDILYSTAKGMWTDEDSTADEIYDYLIGKGASEERALGIMQSLDIDYGQEDAEIANNEWYGIDMASVAMLGRGDLTRAELETLIESGEVVAEYRNGIIYVTNNPLGGGSGAGVFGGFSIGG